MSQILNLGEAFEQYFEIVPAFSETLKDVVYRLRHAVYCEELEYEPKRPDKRERDEYDPNSLHALIRHRRSGEFIGCTRIIRPHHVGPLQPLPFESICMATLDRSIVDPARVPRDTMGEISRFAVTAQFRKRRGGENNPPDISTKPDFGTPAHPRFPYIPFGLCLGTIELARLNGIDTLFMFTAERMASNFRKLGINIQTIGPAVDYHGLRVPSVVRASDIIKNLRDDLQPLYETVARQVVRGH